MPGEHESPLAGEGGEPPPVDDPGMADRVDATARTSPEPPGDPAPSVTRPAGAPTDPATVVRSPGYLVLLVIAAALGVPVAAASYGFIVLINHAQGWL